MQDLREIKDEYEELNDTHNQDVGKARHIATKGKELQQKVKEAEELDDLYRKVSLLFRSISEDRQGKLIRDIEKIVSLGLKVVFEETLEFRINMVQKADQTTASFTIKDSTDLETDIIDARGGGLVSIVGVLLQIVMLSLMKDRASNILFLDESFAHLSDEYTGRMADLLAKLSKKLGMQIVLVTHKPEFIEAADVAYKFSNKKGETITERLK